MDVNQHFNQPINSDGRKACRSVIGTGLAVVQALLERGSRVRVPVKRSLDHDSKARTLVLQVLLQRWAKVSGRHFETSDDLKARTSINAGGPSCASGSGGEIGQGEWASF